jgi:multiple sugar transport system permease protein
MKSSYSEYVGSFFRRFLAYFILIGGGVIFFFPFVWMVLTSLKDMGDLFVLPIKWIPSPPKWDNYAEIWEVLPFFRYTINSVVVSAVTVAAQLFFSSLAAYAFSRLKFPGREGIFLGYLAMLMIPVHVTIIPLFILFRTLGLVDTLPGIFIPQLFSVFGVFLLRQFFLTIPKSLDDSATIDGCGPFGIYWRIIVPLAKPGMATLAIFSFMYSWNNFLWPLIIINSELKKTLPIGLSSFAGFQLVNWPLLMTGSVIAVVPIVLTFVFAQNYFINGIVMSGLKD